MEFEARVASTKVTIRYSDVTVRYDDNFRDSEKDQDSSPGPGGHRRI